MPEEGSAESGQGEQELRLPKSAPLAQALVETIHAVDGGADIDATGASIGGGTPLDDAVGYGCWRVARLLVERGA